MQSNMTGIVEIVKPTFGFIRSDSNSELVYFAFSQAIELPRPITKGVQVTFCMGRNEKGLCANNVKPIDSYRTQPVVHESIPESAPKIDYLAQALIARDNRQLDVAEKLYAKGLKEAPSLELILSFAAMEKNRGRKKEAMNLYLTGISLFPKRKLYEDAGNLALSLSQYDEARSLFKEALKLSKEGTQSGPLLSLGRVCSREDTLTSLREAVKYYERALALSGGSIPKNDLLALNIARLRTQHHRGNLSYHFFQAANFKVIYAELLDKTTEGADLIVQISDAELIESFGVESNILVRVMFKAEVSLTDIDSFGKKITETGREHGTDDQVGLLVTSSISDELKKVLFSRIENKNRLEPAIIPIPQTIIETEQPKAVLNDVFGQWLYRRDLYNVNFPVVGRRFFGRNKDLDELRDAISHGTPVGLFGLRKVGKTSLLKELERRSKETGDILIYIDLLRIPSDISDFRWIYWKLASELYQRVALMPRFSKARWRLGGVFKDFLDVPKDFPVATAFDADLTNLLCTIEENQTSSLTKVVLLLDEIERLLPDRLGKEGLEGYFDFFSYFRGVSQESNTFTLIVTGANAAISEVPQFSGRDNPVFNFFREIYLKFLEPTECNSMLIILGRGMGIRFAKGSISKIFSLTGGHPFFSRQLCSYIAGYYKDRPLEVTPDMIETILEQYLTFCENNMREIFERLTRDYPEERDFCVRLAQQGGAITLEGSNSSGSLSGSALRHLSGYQLIKLENGKVTLVMELLGRWLTKKVE